MYKGGLIFRILPHFSEISHENEIIWFQREAQLTSWPPLVPTAKITQKSYINREQHNISIISIILCDYT